MTSQDMQIKHLAEICEGHVARINELSEQVRLLTEQRDAVVAELSEVKEQNSEIMKHAYRSKSYLDNNRAVDAAMGLSCAIEVKQRKTPYADYAIAALRAEGVDSAVGRIMVMMNHQNDVVSKVINILQMHASELRSKSVSAQQDRQLRESKGANHE